jgi:hypothetical protein
LLDTLGKVRTAAAGSPATAAPASATFGVPHAGADRRAWPCGAKPFLYPAGVSISLKTSLGAAHMALLMVRRKGDTDYMPSGVAPDLCHKGDEFTALWPGTTEWPRKQVRVRVARHEDAAEGSSSVDLLYVDEV